MAFSALQIICIMYAGFKRIEPGSLREPQFSFARRHGKRLFLELPEKIFE
jgi:hypothetical protein